MSSITGSPGTPISGIETLRAKSGWIVALGAVYIIAGIVAIGSVVIATVATVFIVGIMMLIAGVAEVINAFQNQDLRQVHTLAFAGRALYRCGPSHVRESASRSGDIDAFPRIFAHCVRDNAGRSRA